MIYTSVVRLFPIDFVEFSIISLLRVHRSIMVAMHVTPCLASQSPWYIFTWFVVLRCPRGSSRDVEAKQDKVHARLANERSSGLGLYVVRYMEHEAVKRRARLGHHEPGVVN